MGRREGETNSGQLKVPGLGWVEVWLCALAKPFDSLQEAGEAIPTATSSPAQASSSNNSREFAEHP